MPWRSTGEVRPGTLRMSAGWAFSGNVAGMLSQAGIVALLAKLGSATMVGQYALGLAVVTPVMLLTRLQLRPILATDVNDEYSFSDYCGVRLSTNILAVAMIAVVVTAGGYRRETDAVILLLGLIKLIEGVGDLLFGLLQRYDRWDVISTSTAIKGLLSLFLLGAVLWQTRSLVLGLTVMAGWHLIVLLTYEVPIARRLLAQRGESLRPSLHAGTLSKLTRSALPLGLAATFVSLINNLPRYVVEAQLGEESLGYFAALTQIALAGSLPLQALGQASVTRLALYARSSATAFSKLWLTLVSTAAALGIAGVAGSVLWGERVLSLVYRPEYAAYQEVFVWLMAGAGISFVSSTLGYTLTGLRLFRVQLPLYGLTGAACFASLLWLVPAHGLIGAAYANIITWSVATLGGLVVLALCRSDWPRADSWAPCNAGPSSHGLRRRLLSNVRSTD